jgi:cytochrome b561
MATYSLGMRIGHWVLAAVLLTLIFVGWTMTGLPKADPDRAQFYFLHKSVGVTVLLLVALRIFVRRRSTIPKLPKAIPKWQAKAADLTYLGFYVLMIGIPIVGILMTNAFGLKVSWFGIELPKLFDEPNRELGSLLRRIHGIAGYTSTTLICCGGWLDNQLIINNLYRPAKAGLS